MVIYKKHFRRYATSRGRMAVKTKYSNCRNNFGRTRPVASFSGLGGQNTFLGGKDFSIYHMFETMFCKNSKIWGAQKRFGGNCPRMPHRLCGPGKNRCQKVFHWGLHVCAGG